MSRYFSVGDGNKSSSHIADVMEFISVSAFECVRLCVRLSFCGGVLSVIVSVGVRCVFFPAFFFCMGG